MGPRGSALRAKWQGNNHSCACFVLSPQASHWQHEDLVVGDRTGPFWVGQ